MSKPFVIALLGAESTGKSLLSLALADALRLDDYSVTVVSEYLRQWCDVQGRVPLQSEQTGITKIHASHIEAATRTSADVVILDTTALMTAVYSDYIFDDTSLYKEALAAQASYDLTLLMGLDVVWVADGLQRDGPQVRSAIDQLIRQALEGASIAAQTVYGLGSARLQAALDAVRSSIQPQSQSALGLQRHVPRKPWQHYCDCCGDGECEQQSIRLLQRG